MIADEKRGTNRIKFRRIRWPVLYHGFGFCGRYWTTISFDSVQCSMTSRRALTDLQELSSDRIEVAFVGRLRKSHAELTSVYGYSLSVNGKMLIQQKRRRKRCRGSPIYVVVRRHEVQLRDNQRAGWLPDVPRTRVWIVGLRLQNVRSGHMISWPGRTAQRSVRATERSPLGSGVCHKASGPEAGRWGHEMR